VVTSSLRAVALAAIVALAACASTERFTLGALAGPGNVEAVDLAVDCRFDAALTAANREATAENPSRRLFTRFLRFAVYTETGRAERAEQALDEAYTDPAMNPDRATSRAAMRESAEGVLEAIRTERAEQTGDSLCPD
jgi:hypothetical protein